VSAVGKPALGEGSLGSSATLATMYGYAEDSPNKFEDHPASDVDVLGQDKK